jgi:hypothetical protein
LSLYLILSLAFIVSPPQSIRLEAIMSKKNKGSGYAPKHVLASEPVEVITTTSTIAADPVLGYKIRVLLHDFLHVTKDPNAEKRINSTTEEHYISLPYLDDNQAKTIKRAIVDVGLGNRGPAAASVNANLAEEDDILNRRGSELVLASHVGETFDAAIRAMMNNFIEKRRASGDARPCGPHYLAPMYASLFGIEMEELQDPKFLGRLRRNGV